MSITVASLQRQQSHDTRSSKISAENWSVSSIHFTLHRFSAKPRGICLLCVCIFSYRIILDHLNLDLCVGTSEFCLNGGTCEMSMTGARCHCPERYQGHRCNMCTERFQGEGCQECSLRFKGVECDTCADGFFGPSCNRNVNFGNFQYSHSVTHKREGSIVETGEGLISP